MFTPKDTHVCSVAYISQSITYRSRHTRTYVDSLSNMHDQASSETCNSNMHQMLSLETFQVDLSHHLNLSTHELHSRNMSCASLKEKEIYNLSKNTNIMSLIRATYLLLRAAQLTPP